VVKDKKRKKPKSSLSKIKKVGIGPKKLTRFERAKVVSARALQIAMGAPVLIDNARESISPIDIALLEIQERVLPISIRRSLPDGSSQNIPLKLLLDY
jgi:DNA-directed RNA polymerase subunit K/omega